MLINCKAVKKKVKDNGKQVSKSFLYGLNRAVEMLVNKSCESGKNRITDESLIFHYPNLMK